MLHNCGQQRSKLRTRGLESTYPVRASVQILLTISIKQKEYGQSQWACLPWPTKKMLFVTLMGHAKQFKAHSSMFLFFLQTLTDWLWLQIAQMPRCRDLAIFVVMTADTTDRTNYFTPCTYVQGYINHSTILNSLAGRPPSYVLSKRRTELAIQILLSLVSMGHVKQLYMSAPGF